MSNPEKIEGYRPFHAEDCLARTSWTGRDCSCGGLGEPLRKPGDEPGAARAVTVACTSHQLRVVLGDDRVLHGRNRSRCDSERFSAGAATLDREQAVRALAGDS